MSKRIISLLILICIYFLLIANRLNLPLQADDNAILDMYRVFSQGVHPPLVSMILNFLMTFFHLFGTQLRILGVICFVITLLLTYFLIKTIAKDNLAALLGAALYSLSPLAIQGSLLIDIDNTVLIVTLMLFILYFAICYENLKTKDCLILGFLFFLTLFSKLSTSLALIPSLLIFYTLRKKFFWGITRVALISFVGISLFLLAWYIFAYSHKLSFGGIFDRPAMVISEYIQLSGTKFLKNTIKILLWFGPILLFIPIVLISRIKKYLLNQNINFLDFCIVYMVIVFLVHIFLLAQAHTFPKYLYPVLPVFSTSISLFLKELNIKFKFKTLLIFSLLILTIMIYTIFISGDIIYTFSYDLKYSIIFNPANLRVKLIGFFSTVLSYYLIILLIYFILKNFDKNLRGLKSFSLACFIVGVSSNLSLNVLQAKASYTTNYYYGRSIQDMYKLGDFFKMVKQKYPQGVIIGPEDVYREARIEYSRYCWDRNITRDPKVFLRAILDKKVICIAYSPSWNSIYTYKNVILKPKIQTALRDNFRYYQIGEYSVWLRRRE